MIIKIRRNNILFLIVLFYVNIAFSQNNTLPDFEYRLPDSITENQLIKKIIDEGDENSYNQLFMFYNCSSIKKSLLPYSLVMANKWNNSKAMLKIYSEILGLYDCLFWGNIEVMDSISRNLALTYLIMSYENTKSITENDRVYRYYIKRHLEQGYIKEENGRFIIVNKKAHNE